MINYQLLKNWPELPSDYKLGNPTGIGMDSHQNIFVFHRADRVWPPNNIMPDKPISLDSILILDRDTGKILNSWGKNLFIMPHGLKVDADDNIWLTDVGLHQVFKFSHDGKLLMVLGEARIPGDDSTHFAYPTDIAIAKDGSFYISDGYGNSRIIKFSSRGEYLFEWGSKGSKPGQFDLPHAIDLDDQENVYVADRENNRVQVFTANGAFIKQFADDSFGKMSSVAFDRKSGGFVSVDFTTSGDNSEIYNSDIIFFDPAFNQIEKLWKSNAGHSAEKCWYHNIMIDDQENIYVTDIFQNSILKFVRTAEG